MNDRKIAIGADIGGSHIAAMAVDIETGAMFNETHVQLPVDSNGTAETILQSWKDAITGSIERMKPHRIAGLGFAMPGPFDYPNGIALFSGVHKFDSLNGIDIRLEMRKIPALKDDLPVRFLNDAACFAIGEAWQGAASKFRRVVAITLGTGFGSAFLEDGILLTRGDGVPLNGWVYHLPYGDSIADDHFSTRWFIRRYREMTGQHALGVKEIAERYPFDLPVKELFHEYGSNLAVFLTPLLRTFRTECLVIGGNIALSYHLFSQPFLAALDESGLTGLHVCPSEMGENAAIAGGARLCDDAIYTRLIG